MAVSLDGGRTFGTPVDTGLPADEVAVAGVGPGVAVVAASGPTGFAVVRTEDAGVTWQPPVVLRSGAGAIRLLAATGQRMLLSLDTGMGQIWWLSEDGGRTFRSSRPASNGDIKALGLDPDGTIWIVNHDYYSRLFFRTSRDDGKTFKTGFRNPVDFEFSRFVASPTSSPARARYRSPSKPGPDHGVTLAGRLEQGWVGSTHQCLMNQPDVRQLPLTRRVESTPDEMLALPLL